MQTIKKNWVYIFFFISLMIFIYSKFIRKEKDPSKVYLEMKTIQTSAGWGYEIYANDSLYIRQENIPAIKSSSESFVSNSFKFCKVVSGDDFPFK